MGQTRELFGFVTIRNFWQEIQPFTNIILLLTNIKANIYNNLSNYVIH